GARCAGGGRRRAAGGGAPLPRRQNRCQRRRLSRREYTATMAQIQRPPADITPQRFFEEWLPAQAAAQGGAPTPMTVRVRLLEDDGGSWDLRLGPGGLSVAAPSEGEPEVTIVQSVADWRAIAV